MTTKKNSKQNHFLPEIEAPKGLDRPKVVIPRNSDPWNTYFNYLTANNTRQILESLNEIPKELSLDIRVFGFKDLKLEIPIYHCYSVELIPTKSKLEMNVNNAVNLELDVNEPFRIDSNNNIPLSGSINLRLLKWPKEGGSYAQLMVKKLVFDPSKSMNSLKS